MSPRAGRLVGRVFTAEYKLAVLAEYDAAEPGEKGAILRREALYSSHVVDWRRARDAGALAGLDLAPRGRSRHPDQVENARLRARAEWAERELAKTRPEPRWRSWEEQTLMPVIAVKRRFRRVHSGVMLTLWG